jgi:hypothetical protein
MPINMFLSKKGSSLSYEEILPYYDNDYDHVVRDEQTDDWVGMPYAITEEGFK